MKPIVLTDALAVGEVPTRQQIAILAKAGFRSLLNSQPDGEVQRFDRESEIAAEARRQGLAYAYAPLSSRMPGAAELAAYAAALGRLPAPIYGCCYSGSRSAAACARLLAATDDVESVIARFAAAGYDVAGIRPWLDEARLRVEPPGTCNSQARAGVGGGEAITIMPRVASPSGFAL